MIDHQSFTTRIFIISLLLWVVLFIVTVKLYLKTKRIEPEPKKK